MCSWKENRNTSIDINIPIHICTIMNIHTKARSTRTNTPIIIRMNTATRTRMNTPMTMLFMKMSTSIREKTVLTIMSMQSMKLKTTIIDIDITGARVT